MWKKLTIWWTLLRGDAKTLWFALRHPAAPGWLKLGALGVVLYLLSPIDIVPDWIPVLGVLDDIVLIPMAIRFLLKNLPPEVAQAAARRSRTR